MPPLHSLCLSPPTTAAAQLSGLSTKPSQQTQTRRHQHQDLLLPLPDLPTHVKEKILSLEIMGVDSGRALAANPALRDASPDSLHHVISFLRSKGLHHKDLARILGMCPRILTSSVRSDLAPVFSFLSRALNVPDPALRRVIIKCPRLLVSSVRDQLKPALSYLQRLGFKGVSALAYNDPVLLVSSVEQTLMPKLEFIAGLGMSREEAVEMVLRCPPLFTFSIAQNFTPKYGYLVEEMKGGVDDVKQFPQYFAFSLEKRIKPRHQLTVEAGVRLPLPAMLKSTDEEFKELIQTKKRLILKTSDSASWDRHGTTAATRTSDWEGLEACCK